MSIVNSTITTHNLKVGYRMKGEERVLFEGLNLSLHQGSLVCFMGSNGIGKSTLIRTILGSHKPLSGSVEGVNKNNVAVVLTDKISNGMMTVMDLVTYGRYPYLNWAVTPNDSDMAAVHTAIKRVRIEHLSNEPLDKLSDGQLQMAMIAKALAQETPTLLLDEPTAHLDLNNRVEIMNLLRSFAKEHNKAILVATHELDLALQTADLIWLADDTKSIQSGIPEDLVLSGAFDSVFKFKGFDLKTGKITHEPYRGTSVKLIGSGANFLWTRNALERNGYTVLTEGEIEIKIHENEKIEWQASDARDRFPSLEKLLAYLDMLKA